MQTTVSAFGRYNRVIKKVLKNQRGDKDKYLLLEDHDPTGYKSKKAIEAKREQNIELVPWPKYSPDRG